jgi:hypothetical protein
MNVRTASNYLLLRIFIVEVVWLEMFFGEIDEFDFFDDGSSRRAVDKRQAAFNGDLRRRIRRILYIYKNCAAMSNVSDNVGCLHCLRQACFLLYINMHVLVVIEKN